MFEPFILLAVVGVVGLVVWLERSNKPSNKTNGNPQ
jgi:hypothetical protein